jgi:lipopolysaccharide/colanic/teichoic acid biosynthesis glycosyltransferase
MDIAVSTLLLIAFSPIFLLISILVKSTSRGPVLFRQRRVGQNGAPFTMLKFRTIKIDTSLEKFQGYQPKEIASGFVGQFKLVNDPRVTPLGRFLRRLSLDELPQFWNVLKGDMSLVGPRPPLPYEVERYEPWHLRRLQGKPGITGLWQVTAGGHVTFDEMVRLDIMYLDQQSLWLDVKLLLATPGALISARRTR